MSRKLTRKQQKFVSAFVETGVGAQAAKKAYDIEPHQDDVAAAIGYENLRKPQIQEAIQEALPDDLLRKVHLEGLFATKGIYAEVNGRPERVDEDADFPTRAKYLDLAYKVKGSYAPEKHVNVNVKVEPDERIVELAKRLNQ